jgi:hypothetical protein
LSYGCERLLAGPRGSACGAQANSDVAQRLRLDECQVHVVRSGFRHVLRHDGWHTTSIVTRDNGPRRSFPASPRYADNVHYVKLESQLADGWLAWCVGRQHWAAPALPAAAQRRRESNDYAKAVSRSRIGRLCRRRDVPLREKTLWRLLYESASRASAVLAL